MSWCYLSISTTSIASFHGFTIMLVKCLIILIFIILLACSFYLFFAKIFSYYRSSSQISRYYFAISLCISFLTFRFIQICCFRGVSQWHRIYFKSTYAALPCHLPYKCHGTATALGKVVGRAPFRRTRRCWATRRRYADDYRCALIYFAVWYSRLFTHTPALLLLSP